MVYCASLYHYHRHIYSNCYYQCKLMLLRHYSLRTRGSSNPKLSAQFAALEYPEPIDPTDIMEYEEDSGAETVMSEEESPLWNLFNVVKNFTMPDGSKIIEPYMKLPSKRYVQQSVYLVGLVW